LYCFRGGLRSQLSQQLMAETGVEYPLIEGGYKAMRNYLVDEFEAACIDSPLILISGPTGSGKTQVIKGLNRALDLEGRAKHRGSSFGALLEAQPAQIDFENSVSIDWLKLRQSSSQAVFVEDEGRLVGKCVLPVSLQQSMVVAPSLVVEEPFEDRVLLVLKEYVRDMLPTYKAHYGDSAIDRFDKDVQASLFRIRKRLGLERYQQLTTIFSDAAKQLKHTQSEDKYQLGISMLLRDYYDPMYTYQFTKRQGSVLFRGDRESVIAWANHHTREHEAV